MQARPEHGMTKRSYCAAVMAGLQQFQQAQLPQVRHSRQHATFLEHWRPKVFPQPTDRVIMDVDCDILQNNWGVSRGVRRTCFCGDIICHLHSLFLFVHAGLAGGFAWSGAELAAGALSSGHMLTQYCHAASSASQGVLGLASLAACS